MPTAQALADLDRREGMLDVHRPLPPATVDSLCASLRTGHAYASSAIEGNVLTLQEGEREVALEGPTDGGRPFRDQPEAFDHAEAFDYVRDLRDRREPLAESAIRRRPRLRHTHSRGRRRG